MHGTSARSKPVILASANKGIIATPTVFLFSSDEKSSSILSSNMPEITGISFRRCVSSCFVDISLDKFLGVKIYSEN